jgi:hypothetical protein
MLIGLCMCIGIYSLRYVDPFTVVLLDDWDLC